MCELFGCSSDRPVELNGYLREFYSHSGSHPNGWGLAILDGREAFLEKEPLRADRSNYLKERLTVPVRGKTALAHIRYATIGNVEYRNCHPFTGKDSSLRRWTLIHNGTIFEYEPMNGMAQRQLGDTDSERILLYVIEQMDREIRHSGKIMQGAAGLGEPGAEGFRKQDAVGVNRPGAAALTDQNAAGANACALDAAARFRILDGIVCGMARGNKLNLLLYDGELLYVHTNYEKSLYHLQGEGRVIFSTQPLGSETWEPVPMTTLLAYKDGTLLFTGTDHGEVFEDSEEKMKYLYQIFSEL